jgi:hypothetical protein
LSLSPNMQVIMMDLGLMFLVQDISRKSQN